MLHIVDTVLEPLSPKSKSNSLAYMHLTAGKLLREHDTYDLGEHSIRYKYLCIVITICTIYKSKDLKTVETMNSLQLLFSTFANKVKELSMQEKTVERKRFQLYDKPGRHTFFIPVDSAFNVSQPKAVLIII